MRWLFFLFSLVSCSSLVNAQQNNQDTTSISVPTTDQTGSTSRRQHEQQSSPSSSTTTDTRRQNRRLHSTRSNIMPVLSSVNPHKCVRSGDLLTFSGYRLKALSNQSLGLLLGNKVIRLKTLRLSDTQLMAQLPPDRHILANHSYLIYLIRSNKAASHSKTNLSIRICPPMANSTDIPATPQHELGQILLLASSNQAQPIQQEILKLGYQISHYHDLTGLDKVIIKLKVNESNISETITHLRNKFPDTDIDRNSHYHSTTSPRLYASDHIAWPKKEQCMSTRNNIVIGIIDGQVDISNPALSNKNITIKNFLYEFERPDLQHGTAIAVLLVGNKSDAGFQGLLPGTQIMAASAIRVKKNVSIATAEGLIRSLDWLLNQHVRLINMSLSGNQANRVIKSAFEGGIKKGLIIFAAAGNEGADANISYPAALPGVIAVTAIDAGGKVYSQANQGKYIDFSAPGVDIWTVDKESKGKYSSGTSYASPYALAVAALYLEQSPSISRDFLYNTMMQKAKDLGLEGHDTVYGWGLVQAPPSLCQLSNH